MPRTARASAGNVCYHVLNGGNGRNTVFHQDGDYGAFLKLLNQANKRVSMRLLAFCLMPNHFHLVAWPRKDGDLSRWMQWLMTSHVRRYHRHYDSSGHVWQGRFKAFPIQSDEHLLTVMRYVERNPVTGENDPSAKSTELELVLGRNATQRLRSGQTARRPSKAKAKLAGLGQPAVNSRRIERGSRVLESEPPLRKRTMAKANCKKTWSRIYNASARPT